MLLNRIKIEQKAPSTTRAGFTLLELLIVLFLLTLGYVSLFSTSLGQQSTAAEDMQSTIADSRNIVRHARRLAIAKGAPIAVKFSTSDIQLLNFDGTTISSPTDASEPYRIETTFTFRNSQLLLRSAVTATELYFDEKGRPVSREDSSSAMEPFQTPVTLELVGYNNGDDDGSYSTGDEAFLLISNVTGELIAL